MNELKIIFLVKTIVLIPKRMVYVEREAEKFIHNVKVDISFLSDDIEMGFALD